MEAVAIIEELARLGVTVRVMGPKLLLEPGSKVPADLVGEVKACKVELLALLGRGRDYTATACVCPVPIGPTGNARCSTCELALLCPVCGRCRGCKLRLKFPPERGPYG
jgi:hypothetical protein